MADRIEREIEEILKKLDNFVPEQRARRAPRRAGTPFAAAQSWLTHRLARISLNTVMMWSLFVVLVAFVVSRGVPWGYWVMIGALIVFGTAFLLSRMGAGAARPATEKRWRGQPMDLSAPPWQVRLKAWIKARRRT